MDFHLHLNSEPVTQTNPAEPACLLPTATVRDALARMNERNEAAVLVCTDGVLIGIFTERDALKIMAKGAGFDLPLEQVMTRSPVALSIHDSVGAAITKMAQGGYRRLPIVDEQGRPTGVVNVEGILHYLVEHFPTVVYNLPPNPHHTIQKREGA